MPGKVETRCTMMSKYSEADCYAVTWVEKTLGVELEPWQEHVLKEMFWAHRQPASPVPDAVKSAQR